MTIKCYLGAIFRINQVLLKNECTTRIWNLVICHDFYPIVMSSSSPFSSKTMNCIQKHSWNIVLLSSKSKMPNAKREDVIFELWAPKGTPNLTFWQYWVLPIWNKISNIEIQTEDEIWVHGTVAGDNQSWALPWRDLRRFFMVTVSVNHQGCRCIKWRRPLAMVKFQQFPRSLDSQARRRRSAGALAGYWIGSKYAQQPSKPEQQEHKQQRLSNKNRDLQH